jgi:flagellar biosynthesis/type III secretory pathway chaperone
VDPSVCRESLASLLSQENAALEQLAALLDREHGALVANDVAALETAMNERHGCIGGIVRLEEERRSLCRMHGHPADASGLQGLLAWCDPNGSLKSHWAECAKRGTRCRELNDRNGALVNARLQRVETLLGALTGNHPADSRTYGPGGAYAEPRAGRVVTTQA